MSAKNTAKKVICALLAAVLLLGAASCSEKPGEETENGQEAGEKLLNDYSEYDLSEYVRICDYKGIKVTAFDATPTAEQIESAIEAKLTENTSYSTVTDRAAQLGDFVNVDFVGSMDDMATPDGMTGNNPSLELGSHSFIDTFEDQIVGMKIGEKKDIHVTFPDYYPNNTDLQGKPATFAVTLNSITAPKVPELNDYFVSTISDFTTVDEYKSNLALELFVQNTNYGISSQRAEIFQYLIDNCVALKYPEKEVNAYKDELVADYTSMASAYGYESLEQLLKEQYNMTVADFEAEVVREMQDRCFQEMMIASIRNTEGVTFTEEDYQTGALEYAKSYGLADAAALESYYSRDSIAFSLLVDKTLSKLLEYAEVADPTTEAEAPADEDAYIFE